jgi:hypothetical protein
MSPPKQCGGQLSELITNQRIFNTCEQSAQTDEAIRGLVRGVPAMRVLDLREEFASGMLRGLNSKINQFGVVILNVKVSEC